MSIGMLLRELPEQEQAMLLSMSVHPGWGVAKSLIRDAIRQATDDLLKVSPYDQGAEEQLKLMQISAHNVQEFGNAFIRSVELHSQAAQERVGTNFTELDS